MDKLAKDVSKEYIEKEIGGLEDNVLLSAVKDFAKSIIFIKENILVSDDGEWDYKLNRAFGVFSDELYDLSSIDIENHNHNYFGKMTIERLLNEFEDFYWLVSSTSPLGYEESQFVIIYEFLDNRFIKRKQRQSHVSSERKYFWDDVHEIIKNVSKCRYDNGHYSDAVEASFKDVIKRLKEYVNLKTGLYFDGEKAVNRAFGFDNQIPVIKFNNLLTSAEMDEQRGIMNLFKGMVEIRNRKAHENVVINDKNRALEYIALASLLMKLLDEYAK